MKKLKMLGSILGLMLGFTVATYAEANCFCKISCTDISGKKNAGPNIVRDYTTGISWPSQIDGGGTKQKICNKKCSDLSLPEVNSPVIAAACCAKGVLNREIVRVYAAVGNKEYVSAGPIGILINTSGETTCTCPRGWLPGMAGPTGSNTTTDGRCKKLACGSNSIFPLPPNGTQIGTWGFTWGNEFWAYGTSANGGAPKTVKPALEFAGSNKQNPKQREIGRDYFVKSAELLKALLSAGSCVSWFDFSYAGRN